MYTSVCSALTASSDQASCSPTQLCDSRGKGLAPLVKRVSPCWTNHFRSVPRICLKDEKCCFVLVGQEEDVTVRVLSLEKYNGRRSRVRPVIQG
jgi:hypothetical protein